MHAYMYNMSSTRDSAILFRCSYIESQYCKELTINQYILSANAISIIVSIESELNMGVWYT